MHIDHPHDRPTKPPGREQPTPSTLTVVTRKAEDAAAKHARPAANSRPAS